jgi:hypothetical protein
MTAGLLIRVLDALPGLFVQDGLKGAQVLLSTLEAEGHLAGQGRLQVLAGFMPHATIQHIFIQPAMRSRYAEGLQTACKVSHNTANAAENASEHRPSSLKGGFNSIHGP